MCDDKPLNPVMPSGLEVLIINKQMELLLVIRRHWKGVMETPRLVNGKKEMKPQGALNVGHL